MCLVFHYLKRDESIITVYYFKKYIKDNYFPKQKKTHFKLNKISHIQAIQEHKMSQALTGILF